MNDTTITLIGNVADHPRLRITKNGHSVTNFRMASTSRRRDQDSGTWIDTGTLWVNVTCWRSLAENVASSLHKGEPVVVTGRYYAREYKVDENVRVAYELEASSVGHDLTRGTTAFSKIVRPFAPAQVELDEQGLPVDQSDAWHGVATADEPAGVRELATAS